MRPFDLDDLFRPRDRWREVPLPPLTSLPPAEELVLSNNQGELSPLEIGMHALLAVPLEKGGRGKTGGLSEYARLIGKDKRTVSENRQAAMVLTNCPVDRTVFLDKAQHLAAIARRSWCPACGGRLEHLRGSLRCPCCGTTASAPGDDVADHPGGGR